MILIPWSSGYTTDYMQFQPITIGEPLSSQKFLFCRGKEQETQDENPIRNLIIILSKILFMILIRFLLKILNRKMASESDQNPIGNMIRKLARILVNSCTKS
jgi:hypothetical protein